MSVYVVLAQAHRSVRDTVTGYRQFRRQARRARRAGLQPVIVLGADGQVPSSAAVVAARVVWRYRSELAPVFVAVAVLLAGWWAHLNSPHWWPYYIVGSAVAAWTLVTFGAWLGLPRLADRVYASVCVFAAGGWVAFAALFGPLTPPLPQVLVAVALLLAIPWWADRRRRDRARVLRVLAAWPDISRAVGLPGSAVQSVSVDVWGWRAWLRLAPGQTVEDVVARIPVLESALGAVRGAVRVYSARDGQANMCEIHVLGTDPRAETID